MFKGFFFGTAAILTAIAIPAPAQADFFCFFCPPATHQVGDVIEGGYKVTQTYGANRFLATRNGQLYYVQGSHVTWLNPRYSIGDQIDELDYRLHRYRED